jgi:hypothetical protein
MEITDREKRYIDLRKQGFFPTEAAEFSKVDLSQVPYFPGILSARSSLFSSSKKRGLTPIRYRDSVYDWYISNGWYKEAETPSGTKTKKADPWSLWRHFESEYKSQTGDDGYYKPSEQRDINLREIEKKLKGKLGY